MSHALVKISQDFDSGSLDVDASRVEHGPDGQPKDPGSAVCWALSPALNAAHVVTPEPSFGMESGFYHRVGRNYMLALRKSLTDSRRHSL